MAVTDSDLGNTQLLYQREKLLAQRRAGKRLVVDHPEKRRRQPLPVQHDAFALVVAP